MPARRPEVTLETARSYIRRRCLSPSHLDLVGVEAEWLTYDADLGRPRPDRMRAAVAAPGLRSGISYEPGGQFELSTPPFRSPEKAWGALKADRDAVEPALRDAGIVLAAVGIDPLRRPQRVLETPRYAAMDAYFSSLGDEGRLMMTCTAALQINLDAGRSPGEALERWRLAHLLGPVLGAAFANSSVAAGAPTGWRSARLANWLALDPERTRPVFDGDEPAASWARYALNAPVMMIRDESDGFVAPGGAMTFAEWVAHGHACGYPTFDDLAYHLTTLFPPVRPRGFLELRMLDAVPDDYQFAAIAVTAVLLRDPTARSESLSALAGRALSWIDACRFGLQHPDLARAAEDVWGIARRALADDDSVACVDDYHDRYIARCRTPADESLEAWIRHQPIERREEIWI